MCGLFGVVGNSIPKYAAVDAYLRQACVADAFRGEQSTGVMRISNTDVRVAKKAVHGVDFVKLAEARSVLDYNAATRAIIGHNRAATRGSVKDANAHPFQRGDITLVHNGHIQNATAVAAIAGLRHQDWEVDSDTAAAILNHEKDPIKGVEALSGAYSLVWWDARTESLFFARNAGRPMWMLPSLDNGYDGKETGSFFFASEAGMIRWLAHRNGLFTGQPYTTEEHKLYEYQFKNGIPVLVREEAYVPKPATQPLASTSGGAGNNTQFYTSLQQRVQTVLKSEFVEEGRVGVANFLDFEYTTSSSTKVKCEVRTALGNLKLTLHLSASWTVEKPLIDFIDQCFRDDDDLTNYRLLFPIGHVWCDSWAGTDPLQAIEDGKVSLTHKYVDKEYAIVDREGHAVLAVRAGANYATPPTVYRGTQAHDIAAALWKNSCTHLAEQENAARRERLKLRQTVQEKRRERVTALAEYVPTPPEPGTVYRLRSIDNKPEFQGVRPGDYMQFMEADQNNKVIWRFLTEAGQDISILFSRAERVRGKELRRYHSTRAKH